MDYTGTYEVAFVATIFALLVGAIAVVNVSANWRVTFRFADGHAVDVDYVDYHWGGHRAGAESPHPGNIVRSDCLELLGLTVTRAGPGAGRDPAGTL